MDKELFNFLKDAYSNNLCNDYKTEIRNCQEDKSKLMRLAMRQQSIPWIATKIAEGKIQKDYIKRQYKNYLNGYVLRDCDNVHGYTYAWYFDYDYHNDINIDVDVAHISFTTDKNIIIPTSLCPTIYISNNSSRLNIICEGYNSVRVYLFDQSEITLEDIDENSNVIVYRYSEKAEAKEGKYCLSKNNKIFDKQLKL